MYKSRNELQSFVKEYRSFRRVPASDRRARRLRSPRARTDPGLQDADALSVTRHVPTQARCPPGAFRPTEPLPPRVFSWCADADVPLPSSRRSSRRSGSCATCGTSRTRAWRTWSSAGKTRSRRRALSNASARTTTPRARSRGAWRRVVSSWAGASARSGSCAPTTAPRPRGPPRTRSPSPERTKRTKRRARRRPTRDIARVVSRRWRPARRTGGRRRRRRAAAEDDPPRSRLFVVCPKTASREALRDAFEDLLVRLREEDEGAAGSRRGGGDVEREKASDARYEKSGDGGVGARDKGPGTNGGVDPARDLESVHVVPHKGVAFAKFSSAEVARRCMEAVARAGALGDMRVKCMLAEPKACASIAGAGDGGGGGSGEKENGQYAAASTARPRVAREGSRSPGGSPKRRRAASTNPVGTSVAFERDEGKSTEKQPPRSGRACVRARPRRRAAPRAVARGAQRRARAPAAPVARSRSARRSPKRLPGPRRVSLPASRPRRRRRTRRRRATRRARPDARSRSRRRRRRRRSRGTRRALPRLPSPRARRRRSPRPRAVGARAVARGERLLRFLPGRVPIALAGRERVPVPRRDVAPVARVAGRFAKGGP